MNITIDKNDLVKGIQIVGDIISTRSNLPVLSYISLETYDSGIRINATDLDITITHELSANIKEPGKILLPAKKFGDIIKEFPNDTVDIDTKKNLTIIGNKQCQFKLRGLPYEEFPTLPKISGQRVIKIDQKDFKEMLSLVSFAISHDDTRHVLNGVLCRIENDIVKLVATDGRRLAFYQRQIISKQELDKAVEIIIPSKTMQKLNHNLDEGQIILTVDASQILLDLGKTQIISRLIEGEFPDYKQVIPPISSNKIKIGRMQFLSMIKRASLLTTPDYHAIKLEILKNKLIV